MMVAESYGRHSAALRMNESWSSYCMHSLRTRSTCIPNVLHARDTTIPDALLGTAVSSTATTETTVDIVHRVSLSKQKMLTRILFGTRAVAVLVSGRVFILDDNRHGGIQCRTAYIRIATFITFFGVRSKRTVHSVL